MFKIYLLTKMQLLNLFGINKLLHSSNAKQKKQAALFSVILVLISAMLASYSYSFALACASAGIIKILPPIMLLVSSSITFTTTFLKSNGILFHLKDYDMVMSLPVSTSSVISSRLISVYCINLLFNCIALVPASVVYGIAVSASFSVWLMLLLLLFLAPLLPITVSLLINVIITAISSGFRYKTLMVTVLYLVLVMIAIVGSFSATSVDQTQLTSIGTSLSDSINNIYPLSKFLSIGILENNWASFGLFALISVSSMAIFIAIFSKYFTKINTGLFSYYTSHNFQLKKMGLTTPLKALYIKELKRYLSSPVYVINTAIGPILILLVSILLVVSPARISAVIGMDLNADWMKTLAPLAITLVVGMSATTACSLSLEGNNRWIAFSSPINPITLFQSKIAVNLTVIVPAICISSTLLMIKLETNNIQTLFLFATPMVYSLFISIFGMVLNVAFPKYDWTNETVAVKRSLPVFATLATGMSITCITFDVAMSLNNPTLVIGVFTIIIAVITILLYQSLKKAKLYL